MLIDRIKSFFDKKESSKIKEIKSRLDRIIEMNETELSDSRSELDACLALMKTEVARVRDQAKGYPNTTIAADVWMDGVALGSQAEMLADFLSDKNFLNDQAKATGLWVSAVLGVCSHYHHMVGPAMIANAKIGESIGNLQYSKTAYSAVLQDFECVLEFAEEDDFSPQGDDLIALNSLQIAASKLLELNEISGVNAKAPEILDRIKKVMSKQNPQN